MVYKRRRHASRNRSYSRDPPDLSRDWSQRVGDDYCLSALVHAATLSTFSHMSPRDQDRQSMQYYQRWNKIQCPILKNHMKQVFEGIFNRELPVSKQGRRQIRSESPTAQRRHHPATPRGDRMCLKRPRSSKRARNQEQKLPKRKRNSTASGSASECISHDGAHSQSPGIGREIAEKEKLIEQIGQCLIEGWHKTCDKMSTHWRSFADHIKSLPKLSEELPNLCQS